MSRVSLLFGALLALVAVGCKGNFSERANAGRENVFRYPIVNKPTTMDPGKVEDGDTIDLLQQTYEGLVGWSEDSKVEPRLATSWDITNGGKTYVFHLRKGVKFQNGRELKAADFKFCIERNCDKDYASSTAGTYLKDIVGVTDKLAGKATEVSGVKVVDDYTLSLTIDKPRHYFVDKLTYPVAFVFAKEALKDPKKEITQVAEMVGTGPFKMEKVEVDTLITQVPFRDYFGGAPKIDRIERPHISDAQTRLQKYKSGEIDLVSLPRQDIPAIQKDEKLAKELHFFDRPSMYYVGLHTSLIPAFKDVRVRRAIAMAIDKDTIVNKTLGGLVPRADSIVPPKVFGHRDKPGGIAYDPEGAKKLLAEAGFPGGKGFPELQIWCRNDQPDLPAVAEQVTAQLNSVLGINATVHPMEWGAYLAKHNKHEIPFLHMRWAADYLDAENFLSTLLASYSVEDRLDYKNPKFDELCAKADVLMDEQERLKLYAQAEDIALQDAVMIPIYYQRDAELIHPRVQGMRESVFGHLPHVKVSLK